LECPDNITEQVPPKLFGVQHLDPAIPAYDQEGAIRFLALSSQNPRSPLLLAYFCLFISSFVVTLK